MRQNLVQKSGHFKYLPYLRPIFHLTYLPFFRFYSEESETAGSDLKHQLKKRVVKHLQPDPRVLPHVSTHRVENRKESDGSPTQKYHPSLKAIKNGGADDGKSRMNHGEQAEIVSRMSDPW